MWEDNGEKAGARPKTEVQKNFLQGVRKMEGLKLKRRRKYRGWMDPENNLEECEEKNERGYRTECRAVEISGNPAKGNSGFSNG